MTDEANYASVDLADYIRIVARRKWLILAVVALACAAAFAYARSQPTKYTASAQLEFPEPAQPVASPNPKVIQGYVQDQASFVKSQTVAARAADILDTATEPRSLLADIEVVTNEESRVVTVRATAETAAAAQRQAQAFAQAYVQLRTEEGKADLDRVLATKDATVAAADDALAVASRQYDAACRDATEARCAIALRSLDDATQALSEAKVDRANAASTPIDAGRILSPAVRPTKPSTPGPVRTVALGGLAGLILGICLAFVRDRLDSRVRDKAEIQSTIGLAPLASIPLFPERYRKRSTALITVHAPDSPEADAFRRLRASVLIAAREVGARVLGVTSANASEGKSTVSANLAVTLSQAGHTVALVSADIRRPSLEDLFDRPLGPGLGEVLEGSATLDAVLHMVSSSLAILPSGNAAANPSDLLLTPRMHRVVANLRDQYDYVIIDTPPVLAVADTLGMVPIIGAMMLVVALDSTTAAEVTEAEEQLARVGAKLIGAVINRSAPDSQRYYGYHRKDQ